MYAIHYTVDMYNIFGHAFDSQ